ncbi:MAG: ribonuclease H-like domain-containing protein [Nitrospirae bacterium]|nr:ribonuclease H-like domain-containing protein [Nitrospirota bacterium]
MIRNTFTFIPGIGPKTEAAYWKKGVFTWEDFERRVCLNGEGRTNKKVLIDYISRAKDALNKKDISFFAKHLPNGEHWKLYKEFYDKVVFLDIETTGLSRYYDVITLIGAFDGRDLKLFIKDHNFNDLGAYLKKFDIIITFNGTLFDVPFVKQEFPNITLPPVHIDLRWLLKTVGITGPLKVIEKKLGINRHDEIDKIGGREAAILWSRFVKEDDEALSKLVLYNTYDTTDLKKLMDYCYVNKIKNDVITRISRDHRQQSLFGDDSNISIDLSTPPTDFKFPEIAVRKSNNELVICSNHKTLIKVDRALIKKPDIKLKDVIRKIKKNDESPLVVGIDLTGSEARPSGVCVLDGTSAYMSLLKSDNEIIEKTLQAKPACVSIDSPLSLPKGRDCADDTCQCRQFGIMRVCERILKGRGINVYPCLIPSMQKLTMRGMRLTKAFEGNGLQVIESYPGAAQDILGFPRKRTDLKALEVDLMNMGIKPFSDKPVITHDELDALTSALVGYFYLAGMYEAIGNPEEKYLIIPDLKRRM